MPIRSSTESRVSRLLKHNFRSVCMEYSTPFPALSLVCVRAFSSVVLPVLGDLKQDPLLRIFNQEGGKGRDGMGLRNALFEFLRDIRISVGVRMEAA